MAMSAIFKYPIDGVQYDGVDFLGPGPPIGF